MTTNGSNSMRNLVTGALARGATFAAAISFLGAAGCSADVGSGEASGEAEVGTNVATNTEALAANQFTGWSKRTGGTTLTRTPAIFSYYTSIYRQKDVYATSTAGKIWATSWTWSGGVDYGWSTWAQQSSPVNINFASSPAYSGTWTVYAGGGTGTTYSALAARASASAPVCPRCIYLKLSTHAAGSSWYVLSNSDLGNTDDFSMVYSRGSLYIVATQTVSGSTTKFMYSSNDVSNGYTNANWTAWAEIPGGGRFHGAPTIAAWPSGILVVGRGTDDMIYGTALTYSTWDGYWWWGWGTETFNGNIGLSTRTGWDMQLFSRRPSNGKIWEGDLRTDGSFDGFYDLAGPSFSSGASAYSPADGRVDIAAMGTEGAVYTNSYPLSP